MFKISAKDQESAIKEELKSCKETFQSCKRLEDDAVSYVYKCKTSANTLSKTLTSLYNAKNRLNAVKSKASNIASSNASSTKVKRAALSTVTELITALTTFVTKVQSLDVDSIGDDSTVISLKSSITKTNVLSFSFTSTQISTASSVVSSISVIIVKVMFQKDFCSCPGLIQSSLTKFYMMKVFNFSP